MSKRHWYPQHWMDETAAGGGAGPTLTVVDNGNGTATATISGSAAGSSNVVSYQAVNGHLGTSTWTSGGSRSGDGTVTVAVAAGYYWWRVVSTSGSTVTVSNVVYRNVTDGVDPVHYRCLSAVQAKIQGLTLSGITNAQVVVRKLPTDRYGLTPPAIIVSPPGSETMEGGVNDRDDIGYPVVVTMLDAVDGDVSTTNLSRGLLWRQKISRALRNDRLTGVAEIYQVRVEPLQVIDPSAFAENLWVGMLLVRCVSREVRGVA